MRMQQEDLVSHLQKLKDSKRTKLFKEVTNVLYGDVEDGSTPIDWFGNNVYKSKLAEIENSNLLIDENNNFAGSIQVSFAQADRWTFQPDLGSLEVGNGYFLMFTQPPIYVSTSKKTTLDIQFQLVVYGSKPAPRLILLPFVDSIKQLVLAPVLISVVTPTSSALQTFSGFFSNHRHCFSSIDHISFNGTNFYITSNSINSPLNIVDLRRVYGHDHLAKVVALHRGPPPNVDPYYLFETSHVSLNQWIQRPWPLLDTNTKYNDPIEISKLLILSQVADALLFVVNSSKTMHGCLCTDAIFIDSNYKAKLLWNISWTPVPPTQEQVLNCPEDVRYTPLLPIFAC